MYCSPGTQLCFLWTLKANGLASLAAKMHIPSVLSWCNNLKAFSHWVVNQKQQNTKSLVYGDPVRNVHKKDKEAYDREESPSQVQSGQIWNLSRLLAPAASRLTQRLLQYTAEQDIECGCNEIWPGRKAGSIDSILPNSLNKVHSSHTIEICFNQSPHCNNRYSQK